MNNTPLPPNNRFLLNGAVIAAVVVFIAVVVSYTSSSENDTTSSVVDSTTNVLATAAVSNTSTVVDTQVQSDTSTTTESTNTSAYKDGTYTATGSYFTPGSEEEITVTVTLADGVVTSSSVSQSSNDHDSRAYQSRFASGYQQYVVGKNIDDISLSRVSGSSLTPQGFNEALSSIKSEAQA